MQLSLLKNDGNRHLIGTESLELVGGCSITQSRMEKSKLQQRTKSYRPPKIIFVSCSDYHDPFKIGGDEIDKEMTVHVALTREEF